jgi:hypothetical protein
MRDVDRGPLLDPQESGATERVPAGARRRPGPTVASRTCPWA